jgi:hypothetical protein
MEGVEPLTPAPETRQVMERPGAQIGLDLVHECLETREVVSASAPATGFAASSNGFQNDSSC